jgi:hypothetical protein
MPLTHNQTKKVSEDLHATLLQAMQIDVQLEVGAF